MAKILARNSPEKTWPQAKQTEKGPFEPPSMLAEMGVEYNKLSVSEKIQLTSALNRSHPLNGGVYGVGIDKYRAGSSCTVFRYDELPIVPTDHPNGKPTKSTILGNLTRSKSTGNICSNTSWIKDNQRLCKIRYYYAEHKPKRIAPVMKDRNESVHRFLSSGRYTSSHYVDLKSVSDSGLYACKDNLNVVFELPNPPSRGGSNPSSRSNSGHRSRTVTDPGVEVVDTEDRAINTAPNFLSMDKWHGAEWQAKLPDMYLPRKEKYDAYASQPVCYKRVHARYRDTSEMTGKAGFSKC